jgi:hypothetical protein
VRATVRKAFTDSDPGSSSSHADRGDQGRGVVLGRIPAVTAAASGDNAPSSTRSRNAEYGESPPRPTCNSYDDTQRRPRLSGSHDLVEPLTQDPAAARPPRHPSVRPTVRTRWLVASKRIWYDGRGRGHITMIGSESPRGARAGRQPRGAPRTGYSRLRRHLT